MLHTAGIFIIDSTDKLLICRATGSDNWSIPKGHIDRNESAINAALRETFEETGMDLKPFKQNLIRLDSVIYKSGKKTLNPFLLKVYTQINVAHLNCHSIIEHDTRPEIDKYEMVTIQKALTKVHEAQIKILKNLLEKGLLK